MHKFLESYGNTLVYALATFLVAGCISVSLVQMRDVDPLKARKSLPDINATLRVNQKPVIIAVNQRIRKGASFNAVAYATARDARDGNITSRIQSYGTVDRNVKGRYMVRYVVENSVGLKGYRDIYVIVD